MIFIYIVLSLIIFRLIIGEPCQVPSTSMEKTISIGDWIWLDKLSYGSVLPKRWADIPFLNGLTWIKKFHYHDYQRNWGYHRIPGTTTIQHTDIIVFNSFKNPDTYVVKRIIAIPGDTLTLKQGFAFINGNKVNLPSTIIYRDYKKNDSTSFSELGLEWISHNYGHLYIPKTKDIIELNDSNFFILKELILQETGFELFHQNDKFTLNNEIISHYTVKSNYYFVMGDNRDNSIDSRHIGFVNERNIIGRVKYVLFSYDKDSDKLIKLRKNRFFKQLK